MAIWQKIFSRKIIILFSFLVPLAVIGLFRVKIEGWHTSFLPPIYASVNALTAIFLLMAVVAIKRKKKRTHSILMKTCMILSACFLGMYVLYHSTNESTAFGGEGWIKYVYFFILITHILCSIFIIPLVLFTFDWTLKGNFEKHKIMARYTFPIWLYVTVTGVIVYFMIRPYYA